MSRRQERASLAAKERSFADRQAYIEKMNAETEQRQITYLRRCIETVEGYIIPMKGTLFPYWLVRVQPYFDKTRFTEPGAERTAHRLVEKRRRELKAELHSKLNTREIR